MSEVIRNFSNGGTVGTDRYNRLAGFNGINIDDIKSTAHAMVVPTLASGGVLAAHTTQTMTHSIRIMDGAGNNFYVMCTNVTTNRTGGA